MDKRVQNYTYLENKTRYVISYQSYRVFFDWGDLLEIPGLQFSHGLTEVLGKPCFWFRLRRDNVPEGTYLDLDPWFGNADYSATQNFNGGDDLVGCDFTTPASGGIQAYSLAVYSYIDPDPGLSPPYQPVKMRMAIYDGEGDRDFIVGTGEAVLNGSAHWIYANLTSITELENSHNYTLTVWFGSNLIPEYYIFYQDGSTNQLGRDIQDYGGGQPKNYPFTFTPDDYWDREMCIACIYYDSNFLSPSVGLFKSSDDPVYSNSWFSVNCTVNDPDGIKEILGGYIGLSGEIEIGWLNGSTFWEEADPNNYCTLNVTESLEAQINSTAFEVSWRIKLSQIFPHDTRVDVEDPPTIMYDEYYLNGTGSHSGLFLFEPEEATEPGIPTGGTVRKTPLEELGVPTPFSYEVAPPEAQYGSIGLVLILTGAVIYYLRRPKTTQQLFKENTKPRVGYGPRKGPGKRRTKTKKAPRRKVQQRKQPKRRVKRSRK